MATGMTLPAAHDREVVHLRQTCTGKSMPSCNACTGLPVAPDTTMPSALFRGSKLPSCQTSQVFPRNNAGLAVPYVKPPCPACSRHCRQSDREDSQMRRAYRGLLRTATAGSRDNGRCLRTSRGFDAQADSPKPDAGDHGFGIPCQTEARPVFDLPRQGPWQQPVVRLQDISLGQLRPFARPARSEGDYFPSDQPCLDAIIGDARSTGEIPCVSILTRPTTNRSCSPGSAAWTGH